MHSYTSCLNMRYTDVCDIYIYIFFFLIHQVRKGAGHLLCPSHCTNISPLPSPGARGRGPRRSSRATRKGESKSDEEIDLDELWLEVENHELAAACIPLGWMCAWLEKVYVGQIGTGTTDGINPYCSQLKSLFPQARMRRRCGSTNVSCFLSNWCGFDFNGSVKVIHLKVKPVNYKEVQS